MYVDEMGKPWKVDGSGTFPKWRVADDQADELAKPGPAAGLIRVVAR
jgi:hypothetical protein